MFSNIYDGKRVLVTGHTGFKGSWLTQWLSELGAAVCGISLPDDKGEKTHLSLLDVSIDDKRIDVRSAEDLSAALGVFKPDVVFHLAAQSLVIPSYEDPLETWSSNVMGTANILDAIRSCSSVKAAVMVTTDKCYKNKEWVWGYREVDELGGHDPYSASKAACELVVESFRSSFFSGDKGSAPLIASARAGNVIGGGDWSEYRIIPDIVRALESGETMVLRNPKSTRPWQHVLESLSGYLLLGQRLLEGESAFAKPYNFGPQNNEVVTVHEILQKFKDAFSQLNYKAEQPDADKLHETTLLKLDSSRAVKELEWQPVWNTEQAIAKTIAWYEAYLNDKSVVTLDQIKEYEKEAASKNVNWAISK